ncbi:MAG: hypothetical protein JST73_07390 [Actinobacteria bacterium]|nr:hypothetical protein [Actinomycetota bacterium]
MSGGKRRSKRGRAKARVLPEAEAFWREDEELDTPEPLRRDGDPTATLRSIGPPPVPGHDELLITFAGVAKRASDMALALSHSLGLTEDERPTG